MTALLSDLRLTQEASDLVDGKFLNRINRIMSEWQMLLLPTIFSASIHSTNLTIVN